MKNGMSNRVWVDPQRVADVYGDIKSEIDQRERIRNDGLVDEDTVFGLCRAHVTGRVGWWIDELAHLVIREGSLDTKAVEHAVRELVTLEAVRERFVMEY